VSFARQPSIHGASSPDRNGRLAIAIATFACLAGCELRKGEAVIRSNHRDAAVLADRLIAAQESVRRRIARDPCSGGGETCPSKSPAFRNIHAIPGPARGLQGFSSSALYA